jgi:Protein of unknown function (DUF3176)
MAEATEPESIQFVSDAHLDDDSKGHTTATTEETNPATVQFASNARPTAGSKAHHSSFQNLGEHRRLLRQARSTPILSFTCLVATALTTIISLAILLGIRNKPVWPSNGIYGFMQPASWLSVLLSICSVCLSVALSDGVSVTWWRQASKEHATIEDLHLAWAAGTSYLDAVRNRAWKRYKYITFATLAILLIPINGFLLQAAISTEIVTQVHNANITIPMVPFLDPGYSAFNDGLSDALDPAGTPWSNVWAQVQNVLGSKNAQYAYIGTYEDGTYNYGGPFPFTYSNDSVYTTHAQGAGFDVSCETYSHPYNFTPTVEHNITGGRIFSATVSYDLTSPNNMTVEVYWKNESSCAFHILGKRCKLAAATVLYPIQVQMNISSSIYSGPFYSLQGGTTRQDDKTLKILPVFPQEGVNNWTYAGIPLSVGAYYNSTIDITDYLGGVNGSWVPNGPLADTLGQDYNGNNNVYFCQVSFQDGLEYLAYLESIDEPVLDFPTEYAWTSYTQVDLAEVILNRIRQAMFLSSVYMGAEWFTDLNTNFGQFDYYNGTPAYGKDHYVQELPALRSTVVAVYNVRLYLWAISMVITFIVMGIILPLFWGYWRLTREPSMSPIDLARVFHAPILSELDPGLDTKRVLHVVGGKNVHNDLHHGREAEEGSHNLISTADS